MGYGAWGEIHPPQMTARHPMVPDIFSSVSEARHCLEFYWHMFTLFGVRSNGNSGTESYFNHRDMGPYLELFFRWSKAFDAMTIMQDNSFTEGERCAVKVLQMRKLILSTSLDIIGQRTGADDQMMWDKYGEIFEQVVALAESILVISPSQNTKTCTNRTPMFTLDADIVGPLYDLARRCREPLVRRKAIRLLYTYPRQEGMWDGVLAARVAEQVVAIEESGLGEVRSAAQVPDWARVSDMNPIFDQEQKKALLCYQRYNGANSAVRTNMQEVIEWD